DAARTRSASMKDRKTDYGTVILHGLLAAAIGVAFVTGLRIATEAPGRQWLNLFDAILPRENVWVPHMQAALLLVALALAYAVYLVRAGRAAAAASRSGRAAGAARRAGSAPAAGSRARRNPS